MPTDLRDIVTYALGAVFLIHAVGAAVTFSPVPSGTPFRSWLISLAYVLMMIDSGPAPLYAPLLAIGSVTLLGSLVLFVWARHAIARRRFSLIFSADEPEFLFTGGPFAYVRNPFYASYLLGLASAVLMLPTVTRLAVFGAMIGYFTWAARFEEGKFATSPLALDYDAYRRRTGRFLPRLRPLD